MDDQSQPPFDNQFPSNYQNSTDDSAAFVNPQPPPTEEDSGGYRFGPPADMPSEQQAQLPEPSNNEMPPSNNGPVFTGLSGNEMYCLNLVGYRPGNLVVGNSVYALGFIGSITSNIRTTLGGEITQFTDMISSGRKLAIQRVDQELAELGGHGATGVSSEIVFHPGNIEFLSVGSSIYRQDNQPTKPITSSSDGQEFFCQIDAGYMPVSFVIGNVAYSIGIGRNIMGEFKEMIKGEIKQYSNVFNVTRNLALQRIVQEAKDAGANSVIGIRTTILPIGNNGVQEMVMMGTSSYTSQAASVADAVGGVLTSDLTAEEMWNMTQLGYVPLKLILGTSVYSLGLVGGVRAAIRGFVKGEISTLTQLIYGAREESLKKVQAQAQEIGADDVIGIKTYIYQLGGDVIEFLAIGTAVKKVQGVAPRSTQIPPQAIIRDKNTFVDSAEAVFNTNLGNSSIDHHPGNNIV